jgi:Na+/melibiose symporter-like transporter
VGLILPFLIVTPIERGVSLGAVGTIFAVHSAVAIVLEVPSGALADAVGRRRVMLWGAALTVASLVLFALAQDVAAFMASVALLAAGRALVSGSLAAWYVDSLRLIDPVAPLARGLSRGTAAEGVAMAFGSVAGGILVAAAGTESADGLLSVYSVAALAGAVAALAYLAAVALLVHEPPEHRAGSGLEARVGARVREILATARREAVASTTVRVVLVTAVTFGLALTAVELLWQPQLIGLIGEGDEQGLALGGLSAASMLAVAVGAAASPALSRRLGIRVGYVGALAFAGVALALLGVPESALAFAAVFLLTYLGLGLTEPIHVELLNEAVGSRARATMISAESLAAQSGALVSNLGVAAFAAAQGAGAAWAVAGALTVLTGALVARPLLRSSE